MTNLVSKTTGVTSYTQGVDYACGCSSEGPLGGPMLEQFCDGQVCVRPGNRPERSAPEPKSRCVCCDKVIGACECYSRPVRCGAIAFTVRGLCQRCFEVKTDAALTDAYGAMLRRWSVCIHDVDPSRGAAGLCIKCGMDGQCNPSALLERLAAEHKKFGAINAAAARVRRAMEKALGAVCEEPVSATLLPPLIEIQIGYDLERALWSQSPESVGWHGALNTVIVQAAMVARLERDLRILGLLAAGMTGGDLQAELERNST